MIELYLIHLLTLIGIYLILAISLQLTVGFTGMFNFGHIGFFAIGAYTSALLSINGVPFIACLVMAGLISALSGLLLIPLIIKLRGDYLALATMGFSFLVYALTMNLELTGGVLGIPGIPKAVILGIHFSDGPSFLALTTAIATASYFILQRITESPFGKVLESIRDNEIASRCIGKNALKMKVYALTISVFFAGIAGSLYAHYTTFIEPTSFTLLQLIPLLCIVIIGGFASLRGTLVATLILVILPEPMRFLGFSTSILGPARQIIYALVLLIMLIFRPRGIGGKVEI